MFHSRSLNNRINHIHERAVRIVYKDYYSSFEELLEKISLLLYTKGTFKLWQLSYLRLKLKPPLI